MNNPMYGVCTDGVHYDASDSVKGAKRYATNRGYNKVSVRWGYSVMVLYTKTNGKWVKEPKEI